MSRVSSLVARMGDTCTLHTRLATAARTAPTNWPDEETWTDSTIKIFVDEITTRERDTEDAGRITEKRMKAFVEGDVTVSHMDRITHQGELFEVESVPTIKYKRDVAQYVKINLVRLTP